MGVSLFRLLEAKSPRTKRSRAFDWCALGLTRFQSVHIGGVHGEREPHGLNDLVDGLWVRAFAAKALHFVLIYLHGSQFADRVVQHKFMALFANYPRGDRRVRIEERQKRGMIVRFGFLGKRKP